MTALLGDLGDEDYVRRFDLYGALWLFCSQYHGGQASRGYRILSRLVRADYCPGMNLQRGEWNAGIEVVARPKPLDAERDCFDVYATTGSNDGSRMKLGTLQESVNGPMLFTLADWLSEAVEAKYTTAEVRKAHLSLSA